jgi:phage terminase small subunit
MRKRDPITGLTHQQEVFAKAVAIGKSLADAYREAYPTSRKWKESSLHPKASTLADDGKVMARVAALRAMVTKKFAYTFENAMAEVNEALEIARATASSPNMVRALTLKAKLAGLLVNKIEIVDDPLKGMTHEDAKQLLDLLRSVEKNELVVAEEPGRSPAAPAISPSRLTH